MKTITRDDTVHGQEYVLRAEAEAEIQAATAAERASSAAQRGRADRRKQMTNANTTSESGRDASACNEGLGPLPERWYVVDRNGLATACADEADARRQELQSRALYHRHAPYRAVRLVDGVTADALRAALTELRDRIKAHPAYADLTEDEELETGGDTAELSYLARVADAALRA